MGTCLFNHRPGSYCIEKICYDSEGFNRYRGKNWMKAPCRSCSDSDDDLGSGCRCQAFLLPGDPAATNPVCDNSPNRHAVVLAIELAQAESTFPQGEQPLIFRDPKESIRLTEKQSDTNRVTP